MMFKKGTKVVCNKKSLIGSATERGPSLCPRMKTWAAQQTVLVVVSGGEENKTRALLQEDGGDVAYKYWFECEDLKRVSPISLENK